MQVLFEVVQDLPGAVDGLDIDLAKRRDIAKEAVERRDDSGMPVAVFHMALEGIQQCSELPGRGFWLCANQLIELGNEGYGSLIVHEDSFIQRRLRCKAAVLCGFGNYLARTDGGGVPCR